jgi:CRISPR-associated endoribonuclease Cas6
MRIRLILEVTNPGKTIIPVNYQYPFSAWIYRTIAEGNHEFAAFLHNSGFSNGTKSFKLFTFSQLNFPPGGFKVSGDRLNLLSRQCNFVLSFMVPAAVEHFITGLFKNQRFTLGDQLTQVPFAVTSVEVIPEPVFTTEAIFKTTSPVVVGKTIDGSRSAEFLSPEHADYERILTGNLIHKYTAAINSALLLPGKDLTIQEPEFGFKLLNTPRKRGITIKEGTPAQTKIIGYTYDFKFKAPVDLIRTGYLCGFGEKNATGLGCVELLP